MTPLARKIIDEVAEAHDVCPTSILTKSRQQRLVFARVEIAKRLRAHGYTTTQIGRALNRNHCTVCFYLGNTTTKKPKLQPKWKRPRVRHLNCYCKLCYFPVEPVEEPAPPTPKRPYVVAYAGASYRWKERA
jgi:hypothetical protein